MSLIISVLDFSAWSLVTAYLASFLICVPLCICQTGLRQPRLKQYIVPYNVKCKCLQETGEDCVTEDTGSQRSPHKEGRTSADVGGAAVKRSISSVCIAADIRAANSCRSLSHHVAAYDHMMKSTEMTVIVTRRRNSKQVAHSLVLAKLADLNSSHSCSY